MRTPAIYKLAQHAFLAALEARPQRWRRADAVGLVLQPLGRLGKTIQYLKQRTEVDPNNPEAFYTMSTYYHWDKQFRDALLPKAEKDEHGETQGVEAVDKAIQLNAEYADAYVYKGVAAPNPRRCSTDPSRQQALVKEADILRDKGTELREKAAGQ